MEVLEGLVYRKRMKRTPPFSETLAGTLRILLMHRKPKVLEVLDSILILLREKMFRLREVFLVGRVLEALVKACRILLLVKRRLTLLAARFLDLDVEGDDGRKFTKAKVTSDEYYTPLLEKSLIL